MFWVHHVERWTRLSTCKRMDAAGTQVLPGYQLVIYDLFIPGIFKMKQEFRIRYFLYQFVANTCFSGKCFCE